MENQTPDDEPDSMSRLATQFFFLLMQEERKKERTVNEHRK